MVTKGQGEVLRGIESQSKERRKTRGERKCLWEMKPRGLVFGVSGGKGKSRLE